MRTPSKPKPLDRLAHQSNLNVGHHALRIIGGTLKRRQLAFAPIDGLRPTPDRLRETLFNWLMWDIHGAKVLDVCAGSGALGFEACSRGAAHVSMIEPNLQQVKFLRQNQHMLNIPQLDIFADIAQHVLPTLNTTFDVIFLDPPYSLNLWSDLAILLTPVCHAKTLIYVEADQDLTRLKFPDAWQLIKQTKMGIIQAGLFQCSTGLFDHN